MCQEIIANDHHCETLGDLRAQVGADNVVFSEPELLPEAAFDDCNCLCHVDIEATAERSGITMHDADDWG